MIFIIMILMRNCSECEEMIEYKSELGYKAAIKNNSICRKCASSGEKNAMFGKVGRLNPFFGQHHTKKTLDKLKQVDRSYTQTIEFKAKQSKNNSGSGNPMFGKSVLEGWVKKYGIDEANVLMNACKKKHSINNSGEGNPMYGKLSPKGSGNGWSGWYKGWYFRSLGELSYMIKVIERFKFNWKSGESSKYKINYVDWKGQKRNYFPDFIIEDKYIIEYKPRRLWESDNVKRKKEAALLFAEERGLKYKLVTCEKLCEKEITKLYESKMIKFLDKYEELYTNRIKKINE